MVPIATTYESYLTNGEKDIELYFSRTGVSFDIPKGSILSQDCEGNMWLDGKPLKRRMRVTHLDLN